MIALTIVMVPASAEARAPVSLSLDEELDIALDNYAPWQNNGFVRPAVPALQDCDASGASNESANPEKDPEKLGACATNVLNRALWLDGQRLYEF